MHASSCVDGDGKGDGRDLLRCLAERAARQPDGLAFAFLVDGERIGSRLTYGELDRAVTELSEALRRRHLQGGNALLAYDPGLTFVVAFLACLRAGTVAVPVPVPERRASLQRTQRIAADARTTVVLTDRATRRRVGDALGSAADGALTWIESDHIAGPGSDAVGQPCAGHRGTGTRGDRSESDPSNRPGPPEDPPVALLQYTSGSTGDPKGVMVTHQNLWRQAAQLDSLWKRIPDGSIVSWLPTFHDMGLIFGVVLPIYTGMPAYLMAPESFIRRPRRWLQAVARFRATHSIAPNFAYERCLSTVTHDERADLDLSSWEYAINGSETVRSQTMRRFAAMFRSSGLRPESLMAGYGLAEATLMVTGSPAGRPAETRWLSAEALRRGHALVVDRERVDARPVTTCGRPQEDTVVQVVDPETCRRLDDGQIGEVWISGACVAAGYWLRPHETESDFRARVVGDSDDTIFLRSGDLGFLHEGDLYITGRRKDLIVINGENYYPADIEFTAEQIHETLRVSSTCAFSIEDAGVEKLVVAVETDGKVRRGTKPHELIRDISTAIWREHGIPTFSVLLVKRGALFRTTSGKLRRGACRNAYLAGELPLVTWTDPSPQPVEEILDWLREWGRRRVDSRLMDERRTIPPHIVLALARRGLFGIQVPRESGGLALGEVSTARIFEQLAAIDLSLATFVCDSNILGVNPILSHAGEQKRELLLPDLAAGRILSAFAMTEPEAGSAMTAIRATAREIAPGRWSIDGTKSWSGTSAWSDLIVTFVHTRDRDDRPTGMTGFVIPTDAPGVRIGKEELTMGMRSMVQNTMYFENVEVADEDLLGAPGEGLTIAQHCLMRARLHIGALCLGAMKRCLQLQLRYAERREIGTGRLLDNPVMRERLAAATAAVACVEALVHGTAELLDGGEAVPDALFLVIKITAPEILWKVVDGAIQALGGRGYIETNILPQFLRDARVLRIFEGPTESLRMHLGSTVMAGDRRQVADLLTRHCGAHDLAAELEATVGRLQEQCGQASMSLTSADRTRAAHDVVGEMAAAALVAAMTRRAAAGRDGRYARAVSWSLEQLDLARRRALCPAGEIGGCCPAAQETAAEIGSYTKSIGTMDRQVAGVVSEVDPYLRETFAPAYAHAIENGVPTGEETPEGDVHGWLMRWVAGHANLPLADLDGDEPLPRYGVDSVSITELIGELSDELGIAIPSALVWEFPSINGLSREILRSAGSVKAP